MISNTKAFIRLKKEQQRILDFSVLISHAIPNIKKTIHGVEKAIPHYGVAKADYFNNVSNERIKELSKHYKENLSKYVLLSGFSFFESYFRSVVEELFDFHGGYEMLLKNIQIKHQTIIANNEEVISLKKRKLQEPYKKKNHQRYKKNIEELDKESGYRRPSEYLSALGVKYLKEQVLGDKFKSHMIPNILEIGFSLNLNDKVNSHEDLKEKDLKESFEYMRDIRNKIGHGDNPKIGINKTIELIKFLRYFAVKIDKHLVENFFVLERY